MGKRKHRDRTKNKNKTSPPPSPAYYPHYSQMDTSSKEISSHPVGRNAVKPMLSLTDIMGSSVNLQTAQHPPAHHRHHNLSRSLLLKLPRHYYSLQYSQRNSANHSGTAPFHGRNSPVHDEKLSLKLAPKQESDCRRHAERREKTHRRKPDRIRSSSLAVDAVSPDVVEMACGLCQRPLMSKPCILSAFTSSDLAAVAVLVCGHFYHADCLETNTSDEDRRDPPCPVCVKPPTVDARC